jgi:hypothetical protein
MQAMGFQLVSSGFWLLGNPMLGDEGVAAIGHSPTTDQSNCAYIQI